MDLTGIGSVFDFGSKIIDKIFPDANAAATAKLELIKAQQAGVFKEMDVALQAAQMQADINKVEAAAPSLFVSGWRPAVGWVCVSGFACSVFIFPLVAFSSALAGHPITPPTLDTSVLMTLLGGMLGLGGFRTVEKLNGVASK